MQLEDSGRVPQLRDHANLGMFDLERPNHAMSNRRPVILGVYVCVVVTIPSMHLQTGKSAVGLPRVGNLGWA